jgi:hypothetical protein
VQGTRSQSISFPIFITTSKELQDRFHTYGKAVGNLSTKVKWDFITAEYIKQAIRLCGSVSANYTEASDDLG